jgi:hypothetical protein
MRKDIIRRVQKSTNKCNHYKTTPDFFKELAVLTFKKKFLLISEDSVG